MIENEIKAIQLLSEHVLPAGVVISIETVIPAFLNAIRETRDDLLIFEIQCLLEEASLSSPGIIRINGTAKTVGLSWIFPVDMVFLIQYTEEELREAIDIWKPRIIDNGILVFLEYGAVDFVKPVVDEKMADCEQIASVDSLVAYRVRDKVTSVSWSMMQESYSHHGVIH